MCHAFPILQYQTGDPQYQTGDPRYQTGDPQCQTGDPQYQAGDPQYQSGDPQYQTGRGRGASRSCESIENNGFIARFANSFSGFIFDEPI